MRRHFHFSMKPVRRSKQESSVAVAAYQGGLAIHDRCTGILYDFRAKQGVEFVEVVLPLGAPLRLLNPAVLWNEVESIQRNNGQPARRIELSLPWCLSAEARTEYCQEYARSIADRFGIAVQFAIHAPDQFGLDDSSVPETVKGSKLAWHAHFLLTTNTIDSNGWGGKHATRELDGICARKRKEGASGLMWLRRTAAELQNDALKKAGESYRVSHLSLAEQRAQILDGLGLPGDISRHALEELRWDALKHRNSERFAQIDEAIELDREPIGKVGKCAMALERKGIKTRVAEEKLHGPKRRNAERAAARERARAEREAKERAEQFSVTSDAGSMAAYAVEPVMHDGTIEAPLSGPSPPAPSRFGKRRATKKSGNQAVTKIVKPFSPQEARGALIVSNAKSSAGVRSPLTSFAAPRRAAGSSATSETGVVAEENNSATADHVKGERSFAIDTTDPKSSRPGAEAVVDRNETDQLVEWPWPSNGPGR